MSSIRLEWNVPTIQIGREREKQKTRNETEPANSAFIETTEQVNALLFFVCAAI